MYKLGIVVGKFAPLTLGHINLINIAATECEKVMVILSHDDRWLARQSPRDQQRLSRNNRRRWLDQTFADVPHVFVEEIDESDMPEFPNGWQPYCWEVERLAGAAQWNNGVPWDPMGGEVAIFSSEDSYTDKYAEYLPLFDHQVVDPERTNVPISATMIREHLYDHWGYLPSVVRRDYTLRVMVMGVESTGKTSLVKALAKQYATSWVEEYGRTYCETVLGGSEATLRSEDYPIIAYRHKVMELEAQERANRVVFIDTGAFSTEYFHRMYEGKINEVVTAIAKSEDYDLVLILSPDVPWVDDGLRLNPDRTKTGRIWDELLATFPNQTPEGRTVYITGTSYRERFDQAISAVREFMANIDKGVA